jgi:hypothetical protein
LELGQLAESSNFMVLYRESLLARYSDHRVVEISDNLTALTLNSYQNKNAGKRIIMLAERKPSNQQVFDKRQGADADAMVMYGGYYCLVTYRQFRQSLRDVWVMIDSSIAGTV